MDRDKSKLIKGEMYMQKDEARMARHQQYLEQHLPLVEELFSEFQDRVKIGEDFKILNTKHENKRSLERAVSMSDVKSVIVDGFIIETSIIAENVYDVLIMSFIKMKSVKKYRPLHVSAIFHANQHVLTVKTVYDPRSKEEQWTNNYTTRVFFK